MRRWLPTPATTNSNCTWAAAARTNTTRASLNITMSPLSARAKFPWRFPARSAGPKNVAVSDSERSISELLAEKGPHWRDARVEFHRRIAFPAACLVFALLGVPIGVRPAARRACGWIDPDAGADRRLLFSFRYRRAHGAARLDRAVGRDLGGQISSARSWASSFCAASKPFANQIACAGLARYRSFGAPRPARPARGRCRADPASNGALCGRTRRHIARRDRASWFRKATAVAFPMLIDVYLLQQFFYYFLVLLAGFHSDF